MRRTMMGAMIALAVVALPVTAGCQWLPDPAKIEGATPAEANELRLIQAALLVKAANDTISQQLDARLITAQEASRLLAMTDKARAAVVKAREYLPLENATFAEQLNAVNVLLIQLLQERIIKEGVAS